MRARSESPVVRVLGVMLAPFVLLWDAGRWLLFGMFSIAERLDPIAPLMALSRRLLPLLVALRPRLEWLVDALRVGIVWCARPLLWLMARLSPLAGAAVSRLALLWQAGVRASRPLRHRIADSYRWVASQVRPVWVAAVSPVQVIGRKCVEVARGVASAGRPGRGGIGE